MRQIEYDLKNHYRKKNNKQRIDEGSLLEEKKERKSYGPFNNKNSELSSSITLIDFIFLVLLDYNILLF